MVDGFLGRPVILVPGLVERLMLVTRSLDIMMISSFSSSYLSSLYQEVFSSKELNMMKSFWLWSWSIREKQQAQTTFLHFLPSNMYSWHDWQQWATQHNSSKNYDSALIMHACETVSHSLLNVSFLTNTHRHQYFAIFWTWSVCCIKSDLVWLFSGNV